MNVPQEENATDGQLYCEYCRKMYPSPADGVCPDDGGELIPLGPDPLIGTYIDNKYEILSLVGRGGMSIVYKARHRYMGRLVAVKLLKEKSIGDIAARRRFEEEARAASAITHQNIVTVYDFGFAPKGQPYLVMDFLEGASLDDLLEQEKRIPIDRAIPIFLQICAGLEPVHEIGLVHRDLKPSNVVVLKQPHGAELVKIVDFGIALFLPVEGRHRRLKLTETGQVFGSADYMSPEQCQGMPVDARSDIYSLGCLMYETLSGVSVFAGDTFGKLIVEHITAKPQPFNESAPGVEIPQALEEIVMKCLQKDPADRYQTIGELHQQLRAIISGSSSARTEPNVVAAKPASGSLWRTGVIVTVALLICIGGLVFLASWQKYGEDPGTIANRIRWQWDVTMAHHASEQKNFAQASELLTEAKTIASGFNDRTMMLSTLQLQADLYGKSGNQKALNATNREIAKEMEDSARLEYKDLLSQIKDLAASKQKLSEERAKAVAAEVLSASSKLYAARLYREQETLLWAAIETFQDLNVHPQDDIADFDMAMVECLYKQQRWPEIRPYLTDVIKIRDAAVSYNPTPEGLKEQVKAYLKIGQFDRDEGYYKESKVELAKALQLTEKNLPDDVTLLSECINSYADLMRLTGNMAEYQKYIAKSDALWYQQEKSLQGGNHK